MSVDLNKAAIAVNRFGMGARADTLAAIASDPRAALLEELGAPPSPISNGKLLSSGEEARAVSRGSEAIKEKRRKASVDSAEKAPKGEKAIRPRRTEAGMDHPGTADELRAAQVFLEEAQARFDAAVGAKTGFIDRLVWFWSNHFCVSGGKTAVRPYAGAFEREAIRPHVLGKFSDLLLAVEKHPAMLIYLDNVRSMGPDSPSGQSKKKGLNENLAREIMELHTLGVRTGYSQADVTSFAKAITGWTVSSRKGAHGGEFEFDARDHEPGPQTILGKSYPEAGVDQGTDVLKDIARNPATAKHVVAKFVRHFISDKPPTAVIEALTRQFSDNGGDLKALTVALVSTPEALAEPRAKLKRPAEWMTSIWRATGAQPDMKRSLGELNSLGEPLWRPPSPKGFPDDDVAWMSGLPSRLDIATQLAARMDETIDARKVLDGVLGSLSSIETRQAVAAADSGQQGLALLFMSPEFMRR